MIAGRFRILATAGRGGSGTVYRARDHKSGETVAVKVVEIKSEAAAGRFAREVAALAAIDHPAVVRYIDHGPADPRGDRQFLAMEWLEGVDLRTRLAARDEASELSDGGKNPDAVETRPDGTVGLPRNVDGGAAPGKAASLQSTSPSDEGSFEPMSGPGRDPLTVESIVILARRMSEALAQVHGNNLLHRDIKPSNIFLVDGDVARAKLVDFGVVRSQEARRDDDLTKTGMFIGTPLYTSPEQARSEHTMSAASDVWSLGVVLYEALTGVCPFKANHFSAVLARILFDEVAPLQVVAPHIPRGFSRLVDRMIQKDAFDRPVDGAELCEALSSIELLDTDSSGARPVAARSGAEFVSRTAVARVNCVLFARGGRLRPLGETFVELSDSDLGEEPDRQSSATAHTESLVDAVRRYGDTEVLADGTVFVVPRANNPKDQAVEAAKAALGLAALDPKLRAFIALGRAHDLSTWAHDDIFDRAVGAFSGAFEGEVRVDGATANLLEGRFQLLAKDGVNLLQRELEEEERRLLLGQPTPFVGRRRELVQLEATWEEACLDEVSRAVLVTGPAGSGKSRLRWEFHRGVREETDACTILSGHGDSLAAGAPLGLIGPALRRWFNIQDSDSMPRRQERTLEGCASLFGDAPELRRTVAFLGELVGAGFEESFDPSLAAARRDPMLRGQNMGEAFVAWLRALTRRAPVLLMLEDIHWGDSPSLKYVDEALRELEDAPLMVLAMTRPGIEGQFPDLWSGRPLQHMNLTPLTPKACGRLIDKVLETHEGEVDRQQIIRRCEGNAFYLEELIRASVGGEDGLVPDTVYGMVHARLDALGPGANAVLKIASIFGESFWLEGVARQVAEDGDMHDVARELDRLVKKEVIRPKTVSSAPDQKEYRFHHALVRDAAYAMLSDKGRARGHKRAADWLSSVGMRDPLSLAGHYDRGGDSGQAIVWYGRAAEQALEGGDLESVCAHVARALDLGADGDTRGQLLSLDSVASYWKSDYQRGRNAGVEAVDQLSEGSASWFVASGSALVSSARLADYETVEAVFDAILETPPREGASSERLIAMCRGAFQLIFAAKFSRADAVLERIADELEMDSSVDALTRAQGHHVQGVRKAHVGDVAKFLMHLERAVECFELAGDRRNTALERTTVAWCWAELGELDRATELCRANLAHCQEIKNQQAITYAQVNLGYILALSGESTRAEAREVLNEAIRACRAVGNQRLEGWARAHLTSVEHADGAHALEHDHAEAAVRLLGTSPGLRAWALATRARAHLAENRVDRAYEDAAEAMETLEGLGGILQGETLPPLVFAQVKTRRGDADVGEAVRGAIARLERRTERLGRDDWRQKFLSLPDNKETLMLAMS